MSSPLYVHMKHIGKRIRLMRLEKNVTLKDLGNAVGIHFTHLGKIERGLVVPNEEIIIKIENFFNVKFEENIAVDNKIENLFFEFLDTLFFRRENFSYFEEEIAKNQFESKLNPNYFKILIIEYVIFVLTEKCESCNKYERLIEQAVEKSTIYEQIYYEYKSIRLYQKQRIESAFECLHNSCLFIDYPKIYAMITYHSSILYKELKHFEEAKSCIERAKSIFVKFGAYKQAVYCDIQIASIYRRTGRIDLAIDVGNTCINAFEFVNIEEHGKLRIIKNQCWTYILMKDYQKCLSLANLWVTSSLNNGELVLYMIWSHFKLNQTMKARAMIYENLHLKENSYFKSRFLLIRDLVDLENRTPTKELVKSAIRVYESFCVEKSYELIAFYLDIVIDLLIRRDDRDSLILYLKIKSKNDHPK